MKSRSRDGLAAKGLLKTVRLNSRKIVSLIRSFHFFPFQCFIVQYVCPFGSFIDVSQLPNTFYHILAFVKFLLILTF